MGLQRKSRCRKESLGKGDTIHFDGPGRVVIRRTGANGGKVKVVVVGGKVVKNSNKGATL